MKRILAFVVGALFILFTGLGWLALEFITHSPGDDSRSLVYEVMPNKSLRTIAHELREMGLITSELKFIILAKVLGKQDQIRVGEYAVRKNMLPREVLEVIISGKSIEHKVTISEGLNVYEIAKIISKTGICTESEFLTLVRDKATANAFLEDNDALTLEGYLYPETYSFTKYTSAKNLVTQMVANFKKKYDSLRVPKDYFLNRHQLVTLASIIEKETGAAEERPMISSVFHNRLKKGMRLETDPTIIYGILDEGRPYPENLTREDIRTPTKYNTYTFSNETEADGVISKEPGVALCISTTDCLPILMGSPNDKMAVARHAGWRGLEAEIVSKTVGQLVSLGINPQNFSVFVGPHITASNFEVGYDVAQRLDATFAKVRFDSKDSVVLNHPEVGKRRVDLDKLTLAQLKIVGIKPSHVKVIEADTIDNQEYHSFRRDGASAGRQISFVALIN